MVKNIEDMSTYTCSHCGTALKVVTTVSVDISQEKAPKKTTFGALAGGRINRYDLNCGECGFNPCECVHKTGTSS